MKRPLILITLHFMFTACTFNNEVKESDIPTTDSLPYYHTKYNTLTELSSVQKSAFDAFNVIQVNTKANHLYSTLVYADFPCYPPDTNFTISRSELQVAINTLTTNYSTNLSSEELKELAEIAVLAQEEYLVLHCFNNAPNRNIKIANQLGHPFAGVWILPNVLGRRNVILVW